MTLKAAGQDIVHSVGGVGTHILLEFPQEDDHKARLLHLGSALSLSYSVYREKSPVFNCGSHLIDGFSIANKYVAGSLITTMNTEDEFANYLNFIETRGNESSLTQEYQNAIGIKEYHTYMRDDLISFNIHAIFTSEYTNKIKRIVIYDATFLNNGQVMSVDDLITENTHQYIARDISEQEDIGASTYGVSYQNLESASSILEKSLRSR